MSRLRCGLVGATGLAGQQFIVALAGHPLFELTAVAASPRNAGKRYIDAVGTGWFVPEAPDPKVAAMVLAEPTKLPVQELDLIFSAVEADVARELEPLYAKTTPVVSTASAFRTDDDLPLLIPPVNASHLSMLAKANNRGWKGFILPIPNCTTTGLAVALAPLAERFGIEAVVMTSLQAVSGAGRSPGVPALDIIDNVVPYIAKEEEKVERETRKILGAPRSPANFRISATCTRVAVLEGHTETVSVGLKKPATLAEVTDALRSYKGDASAADLPSSPPRWIEVLEGDYRPQPRLDRDTHGGMATSIGRLRVDPVFTNGFKFVLVSHNTKFGAAKGAILLAELLHRHTLVGVRK